MNYKISENFRSNFKKALKGLAVCCALSITLATVIYSIKSSLATPLPSCDSLAISIEARPGANCLYQNLPICTTNPYAVSTISTPNPRVNCADLIDMPLCSDISDSNVAISELKNCVKECANIAEDASKIRGVDYAVHNKDCVRFCGTTLSTGSTNGEILTDPAYLALSSDQKCVAKRCHQSVDGYTGAGSCNLLACNLLLVEELDNSHFTIPNPGADAKQFCDGSSVKCYNFPQNKLPFLVSRPKNTMCQIHECAPQLPASTTCADDTVNIINKGNIFVQAYEQYIVGIDTDFEEPATLNATDNNADVKEQLATNCKPSSTTCLPLVERQYRCTPMSDANPTTLNNSCDTVSTCINGFCSKIIDCNLTPNEPECRLPNSGDEGSSYTSNENDESWFYNPKPMDKSVDNGILLSHMSNDLCYTKDNSKNNLEDNNWGWNGKVKIGLVTIPLGYFHSQFLPDKTRSPGMCDVAKGGYRGTGYLYLCGNKGNINAQVSDSTAYHQENATTTFTNTDTITTLSVCVRFKNAQRPADYYSAMFYDDSSETCGRRECAISCGFGLCKSQLCGFDVCRSLTVKQSQATDCIFDDNDQSDKDCSSIIDDSLRVRAVQYKDRICTFLDSKGQFAYNKDLFMRGTETLIDGTCLGDPGSTSCEEKDSTDDEGSAEKWRAVMRIPYTSDNSESSDYVGYLKKDGTLVKEQECIKVPLRVRPPKLFNLATKENSFRLFYPPLYIINSFVIKGGQVSPAISTNSFGPTLTDSFGPTDFNYPEIEVKFGNNTTKKLSLGLNKTGHEVEDKDPDASATITTILGDLNYSANISIRKEFNTSTLTPTLCLYQTITDSNNELQTLLVQCVDRNLPEINNATQTTLATKKVVISAQTSPANKYDSAKIILKYKGNPATDVSSEVTLGNAVQSVPECSSDVEKYQICAQREECNLLNNECVKNEISIQNASYNSDINEFVSYRNYCKNILTPACNRKKGIIVNTLTTPSTTKTLTNAYGWYNEICISSGFETKLKDIVAYKVMDGSSPVDSVMGKCVINSTLSTGDCANGGKPPECICQDYADGTTINADQNVRKQTPREAGLCIDIPVPGMCPEIKYLDDVARAAIIAGTGSGHGDFLTAAFGGMNNVVGQCMGNWKNDTVNGVSTPPTMNCLVGANDTATWNNSVQNACIRYSCPQVTTTPSIDSTTLNISYTNSYAAGENTDTNKGQSHGYAIWPARTSNDSNQSVTALSCITGFGPSGGSLPTRNCSPRGIWQNISNVCVRKRCSAQNFVSDSTFGSTQWNTNWLTSPANPSNAADDDTQEFNIWTNWDYYGGASFRETPAARVLMGSPSDPVENESIATGTCNTRLGYFPLGAGPTMKCDSNGNWRDLQNRCVTNCDAISNGGPSDGNASWDQVNVPSGQDYVIKEAISCNTGFSLYPYSPPKDIDGNNINRTPDPNNASRNLYLSGAISNPKRKCENNDIVIGNTIVKAAVWKDVYPSCTNKCPGHLTDPRVGVGVTKHRLSDGSFKYLQWDNASPGEEQFRSLPATQDVTNYSSGRDNKIYAVKRVCGNDYKWITYNVGGAIETVVPQCSARSGEISESHATFSGGTLPNSTIDENATLSGTCVPGYDTGTDNKQPVYKCQQKDSNRYIDQFYYHKDSNSGTCEKTCTIPNANATFGTGSKYVSGASGKYFTGYLISLQCKNGYGRALGTPTCTEGSAPNCTQWNYDQVECGITGNEDRIKDNPTITCQNDGTWKISNDCSACRSCNFLNGDVTITGVTETTDTSKLSCNTGTTSKGANRVCNFNADWMKTTLTGNEECRFESFGNCTATNRNPSSGSSITCRGSAKRDHEDCESKTMRASITMICNDGKADVTSLVKCDDKWRKCK